MGKVSHFLGIEFSWQEQQNGHLSVTLTQQSFTESLLDNLDIHVQPSSSFISPYRSGILIDSIGPQDASLNSTIKAVPLFASRSMSAYFIDLFGPLHWMSKRQSVTTGSSAEAEIYATNECVKFLLELAQLLDFLEIRHLFMPQTQTI